MTRFTLGSDPEFMVLSPDGGYVTAIDKVPGTKEHPLDLGNGCSAFYDNVLAECCPKPGRNKEEVLTNFRDCFQRYARVVHPFRLKPQASQEYPASECQHLAAQEFGCSEEYNAYEMMTVKPPVCEPGNYFRSGGGHIHLGHLSGSPEYPLVDVMGRWWLTRMLDCFVGLASLFLDNDPTSQARRQLYGGAGNMRPKSYGLEYRTLSNFWLASPRHVSLIHDLCGFTIGYMQEAENHTDLWSAHAEEIRPIINGGRRSEAVRLWDKVFGPLLPKELNKEVQEMAEVPPPDFYSAWKIEI
jgi:hypothetical protein